jgi:hypothetical protein
MININKYFINNEDKKYLENYCKIQMENNDLIRIKSIMCLLSQKYATYEVMQYIKRDLKISKDKIFHGEADYIIKLSEKRGHIQLVNDLYFNNCYLHQYVIVKMLGVEMEQVQKYIIHHLDFIKDNNDISNLWIFYDQASHMGYHQGIKHGDIDIKEFNKNYIESIINSQNAMEIKEYLQVVQALEQVQKNYA